ncbi:MAG TPA: hypothetical protein VMV79_02260 [Alphaproteobacteria bacterium]|nr:hypothetical protein [Alphaproteobacteria bacterium]
MPNLEPTAPAPTRPARKNWMQWLMMFGELFGDFFRNGLDILGHPAKRPALAPNHRPPCDEFNR